MKVYISEIGLWENDCLVVKRIKHSSSAQLIPNKTVPNPTDNCGSSVILCVPLGVSVIEVPYVEKHFLYL